jgi:glutathione S-transferase
MPTLTALATLPSFAIGLARDLRVRWALEEAGVPYDVHLAGLEERATPAYRRRQPFGQMPVLQDGDHTLFESGAILLYLGERHPALLPAEPGARYEAITWMFATLNSVEPQVLPLAQLAFSAGEAWAIERRPALEDAARRRLAEVEAALAARDWLAGSFSVADILMATTLRMLGGTGIVGDFPRLAAYVERCTARPAFIRALADHRATYEPVPQAA